MSQISDFVIYIISLLTLISITIEGEQLAKIKQNELDCRDIAPLRKVTSMSSKVVQDFIVNMARLNNICISLTPSPIITGPLSNFIPS